MNEDMDIEEALKRYRSDPSPQVKRSVLSRFTHTFEGRNSVSNLICFWKKPIPLYLVAAQIIIAVGLSFFAGQIVSQPDQPSKVLHEALQEKNITATHEVKWEVALSDLL